MRDLRIFYLHIAMYGGTERSESISPSPQSIQLNFLFCECAVSNGTECPWIAETFAAYDADGKPK